MFTAKGKNGKPVVGEELAFGFGITPNSLATAVFQPAKVRTNKKGKAETRVMFGPQPGEMHLQVKSGVLIHSIMLDVEPYGKLKLGGLRIGDVLRVNSTHKLVFTATNEMNKTVPWLPLRFDVMYLDGTEAGATFAPRQVVTIKMAKRARVSPLEMPMATSV